MASRRTPDSSRPSKPTAAKTPKTTPADVTPTGAPPTAPARTKRASAPKPAKTATPAKAQVSDETRHAMIAESAYLRAERRGFAPGGEVADWMAAEQEVDALLNANTGSGPQ
jgi:hypothetical protein